MKWNEAQQQQHKPNSSSSSCLAGDLFTSLPQNTRTTANTAAAMPKSSYGAPMLPNRNLPLESESRVSSMTIADVSPRIAVKKVLLLYEHGQYRQAATFIQRLSVPTFRIILRELPIDIFVEAMPHSIPILETVYTKVSTLLYSVVQEYLNIQCVLLICIGVYMRWHSLEFKAPSC